MPTDAAGPRSGLHLLGNSAWNAAAFAVGVGLNLLILPFVVFRLGIAAFGVAGLVTACVAPALAFSNALAVSTTRELAQNLGVDGRNDARRLFATALLLAGGVGSLIALALALALPSLARVVFNLVGGAAGDLSLAFAFGAGGWLCQCLATVFLALFTARQDYFRLSLIAISSAVISTGSMLILIPLWPVASTFVGCQALGFAASLLLSSVSSLRAVGEWLAWPAFHRTAISRLASIGVWQFFAQAGGLVAGQADRYLLGAFLPPQFVGFYTIAQRLEEAVYIGVLKIGEILFPFFSTLQAESDERVADLLFRSSWVLNALAAGALGALIPVAGPLLHLWTGAEVAAEAQHLLVILSIAGMLGCSANVFVFFLLARGRSRSTALISLVTAFVTVSASAIALSWLGWLAAGWSSCIGMTAQMFITMMLLRQSFSLADMWRRVGHFVLMPLATGIVAALALRYAAAGFSQVPSWWYVGSAYCLAAVIILAIVVAITRVGPYGDACWRDLRMIVGRFLPLKAS